MREARPYTLKNGQQRWALHAHNGLNLRRVGTATTAAEVHAFLNPTPPVPVFRVFGLIESTNTGVASPYGWDGDRVGESRLLGEFPTEEEALAFLAKFAGQPGD